MSLSSVQPSPSVSRRVPDPDSSEFADLLQQLSEEFAATAAHYDRHSEFPHANLQRLHQHQFRSRPIVEHGNQHKQIRTRLGRYRGHSPSPAS